MRERPIMEIDINDITLEDLIKLEDVAYKNGVDDTLEDVNEMLADYGMSIDMDTRTCKVDFSPVDGTYSAGGTKYSSEDKGSEIGDFRREIEILRDTQLFLESRIKKLERAFWGE